LSRKNPQATDSESKAGAGTVIELNQAEKDLQACVCKAKKIDLFSGA